jgi:hypothetical protein
MNFEGDAFISYAHLDNVELIEGRKGWVANLHRALEVRVGQLLGKPLQVWRDPKLSGNDFFADTLVDRLKRVATLISVVSPRYVKSDWTRRELAEFWKAAQDQGGVSFRNKARIFKILKTPVPLELHPPELRSLLGYEFFKIDPETGRVRELDEVFGPEAQRDFWLKLDDLAHDICCLLEMLEIPEATPSTEARASIRPVYLAETASDLKEQREVVRRDLQQHGYTVLPDVALPTVASELQATVRANLAQCAMSIHLVGKSYSLVPEGGEESLVELQNELAIERGEKGDFSRLVWIPPGLEVTDARQRKVIEKLRMDPRVQKGADLLETTLEDLRTVYQERLKKAEEPVQAPTPSVAPSGDILRLYLMYDQLDSSAAPPVADHLFKQGLEVIRPVFDGDEADIREEHEENLRSCDGALILYGAACECWLRRKLREIQKSPGYGRTKPKPVVAISLLPPRNAEKESFRTHEAIMIPQMDGFSPDPLGPFVSSLKG